MKLNVLLTDGNYQNTNAIIRALTSQNLKVGVIYNSILDLNFVSKLPHAKFKIKTNLLRIRDFGDFEKYWAELKRILTNNDIEVFMPVGNIAYRFASLYKEKIEEFCKMNIVSLNSMEIAQDKSLTFKLAERIGIPIPKTYYLDNNLNLSDTLQKIEFPCVIKKTNFFEGGVYYCNSQEELNAKLHLISTKSLKSGSPPIIQEYVEGIGTGYYAVFKDGKCKGYFMHERIHEFPITGGASTFAKSVHYEDLLYYGNKLLEELKWSGVAMIEFKRTINDKSLKLMEINPKYWGSLELSFTAGINFPYLNYLAALNREIPHTGYQKNVYFRWTIPGDWLWCLYSNKNDRKNFKEMKRRLKIFTNIHWDDPIVVIHHFIHFFIKLFKTRKFPHGFIKQKN